ncbi:MAG: deoxyribonuclease IV [Acidothermus sp.]|nr:deoxyribonuclease IV [Acidothermus sp.]
MPKRRPSPIGVHTPVAGGLVQGALGHCRDVGAEAIQLFVSNPRGWARPNGDPQEDSRFKTACEAARLPVFVHAPYLVNLGSPTPATLENSILAIRHCLGRAMQIGARGVVVHAGSAVSSLGRSSALKQVREALLPILDDIPDGGPDVLVEPTAGGGQSLAARVEEVAEYLANLDFHPRLGVCLDTCHLFAAGYDLAAPGGMRSLLNAVDRCIGRRRLKLVHVNDSKAPCGSNRDAHERIGKGLIGLTPLQELFRHPATKGVPLILETSGKIAENQEDVAVLKALRGA